MVQILGGKVVREDTTSTAMGGTELMAFEMVKRVDPELLSQFQIIHSRPRNLELSEKRRIFVAHDLPGDPESAILANGGYNQFAKIVFVSNWQMQRYIDYYGIPWYKCVVIQNAINPLTPKEEKGGPVRLVYHTTPHRGLDVLANAFSNLPEDEFGNVTLDVYSSFAIYGWKERDSQFADLFDYLKSANNVTYHGSVPHDELVEVLPTYDIFAYPSLWPETSCISLMEAMSAGLLPIHSNYGALPETAANWSMMYQFHEDRRDHTKVFFSCLKAGIRAIRSGKIGDRLYSMSQYANTFYSWEARKFEWETLLRGLL